MKKKRKLEVVKKVVKTPCYVCSEIGGKPTKRSKCKICKGTGKYKEYIYYHIYTAKNGQKYCIDKDTIG